MSEEYVRGHWDGLYCEARGFGGVLDECEHVGRIYEPKVAPPAPLPLDVERRLFVLSRLVLEARDEMPDRLNNLTRVNVNHAAAVADPLIGHSCGQCRDLEAEYARLATLEPTEDGQP